ncbi:MAG: hypothetical protein ACE5ES_03655 [Candidatus Nanoarchaeia archaeon]
MDLIRKGLIEVDEWLIEHSDAYVELEHHRITKRTTLIYTKKFCSDGWEEVPIYILGGLCATGVKRFDRYKQITSRYNQICNRKIKKWFSEID